ncbi:uncharacterized protein EKO05_0011503 [Ascochyta rabiei]|uniref:Uncharacterized protein n=1 Tax=Didymella rabiei TaxID=5454 RepID=A0A163AMM7_DIDRA|nr:uncharacterized protein EKO05_0011503 [Ascochyta rabiei]KZM21272.1 hypothetical protein ST47_g7576 [Ascochyta rabiei]UPX21315.1 hypothetical protein EKO05_0011503 [Ascochyta rabiei]
MDSDAGPKLGVKPTFARMDSHQDELVYQNFKCAPIAPTLAHTPEHLHLLALPREIRDHIYSYLHQPHQLRWELNEHDIHCVAVQVPKAPIAAVLRTCTRLHEEYRESRLLRTLAATISTTRATNHETAALTDLQCHAVEGSVIMHAAPALIEHVATLLASIRDLTILANNKRSMTEDSTIWSELQTLEAILSPFHQTLSTIRIGIHQWQDPHPLQMNSRRETKKYTDSSLNTSSFMPTPNATFMGKPLAQQAAGYRLQLVLLQLHPWDQKDLLERFHRHKTGVYVYSNESPLALFKDGLYWKEAEVVSCFPMDCSWFNMQRSMNLNLRDGFDAYGVTDAWIQSEYSLMARRMMEWREKSGTNVADWEA